MLSQFRTKKTHDLLKMLDFGKLRTVLFVVALISKCSNTVILKMTDFSSFEACQYVRFSRFSV